MRSVNSAQRLRVGDVEVARIGLGTNRLTNAPENVDLIREAVATGVNVIDTAHTYTAGESEATIGAAVSPLPADLVVATKGGWSTGRPEAIQAEIRQSLRRLRTDSIALYYLHRVDSQTPIEESVGAIKECRDGGLIRHVGLSNVSVEQIERARAVAPVAAVQNNYSLSERTDEDVVDYCAREGIVFVPYFPLRGVRGRSLHEIADRRDATTAQIALAWLLRRSPVTLPIPGTLSLEHLKQNLAAMEIELTEAEFQVLP
jgi:pyridoxine 4-dehydrogenase